MTPTGNRKRLTKKVDVIDLSDDDSDGKQPLAKRQSLLAPSPPAASPKEVELQEKVAKLEDMYKKAVIAAGQEKAARYAAEGLLDSKRGILENEKNEVEKEMGSRLAELSKQLDDARRWAEESYSREISISRENDSLKLERARELLMKDLLTKKVLELNGELDDTRRKMEEQICEKEVLSRENTALKEELDEANGISNRRQETIDKLKGELAAIKKQFEAATAQRELPTKGKLAQSNGQQPEQQNSSAKTNKTQDDSIRSTDQKDNSSIDLFEQGLLLSNQTISFDEARMKIMHKFKTTVILSWPRIGSKLSQSCKTCFAKLPTPHNLVKHFLSKGHANEMKKSGGAVSLAAVDYWMKKIDETAAPKVAACSTAAAKESIDDAEDSDESGESDGNEEEEMEDEEDEEGEE